MPKAKKNTKSKSKDVIVTQEEVAAQLLEKAKKDGSITQKAIFDAVPDLPSNAEILDNLYTELADADVEIVDDKKGTDDDDEEEVEQPETDQKYLDDIADDSVRLYLREIGKIPLLSPEEELALAQRVVAGDKRAKTRWRNKYAPVVSIAKPMLAVAWICDLIKGNAGLYAVEDDPDKGFGSYPRRGGSASYNPCYCRPSSNHSYSCAHG